MVYCLVLSLFLSACSYRLGAPDRILPGGYKQISIPIFKNLSQEPGIEVSFTNAMIQEFSRSKSARVVDPIFAEAQLIGEILSVQYRPAGEVVSTPPLPTGTVLATTYNILMKVKVTLRRRSDGAILSEETYSREQPYTAPQVKQAGINTVNPLYNLSSRRQNIDLMAMDMMSEAHDRISENF
jgi:hypothetical protein